MQRCAGAVALLGLVANASDERVYEFTDLALVGRAGVFFACSTSEGLLYGACVTAYLPVAGAVSYPGPGSSVSQVSQ